MFKYIVLSVLIALSTARFLGFHTPNVTKILPELLEGFNDELRIANASDVHKCDSVPLIRDINKTLHDLNKTKPNYLELVADVLALYADFHQLKDSCPICAKAYQDYFSNFTNTFQDQPMKTAAVVVLNVASDAQAFQQGYANGTKAYHEERYRDAGHDLARLTAIALKGYIVG